MCNPNRNLHSKFAVLSVEKQEVKIKVIGKAKVAKKAKKAKVVSPKTFEATRFFLQNEDVLN